MNYQDSSSDEVPYLPPDQYREYQSQSQTSLSKLEQRRGRSHFSEDEIRELDTPIRNEIPATLPTSSSIPRPLSQPDILLTRNHPPRGDHPTRAHSKPNLVTPVFSSVDSNRKEESEELNEISWGRRVLGILLTAIPAVLFSVAAHFIYTVSDFHLSSISFILFQGIFWPSFGLIFTDLFCLPKTKSSRTPSPSATEDSGKNSKWILAILTLVQSNLAAAAMTLQILSIQRLNISVSLALSFGFDVVVILIRYITEKRRCSCELLILSVVAYCGYGMAAVPAFLSTESATRTDTAVGVGASVGVMIFSIPASLLLTYLRRHNVRDSILGTSFSFFGCIQALITKGIMSSSYNLSLDGRSVGWVAGILSVVFLGTIFLFLDARLSGLIWRRDDAEESGSFKDFSSITRTRIAVFILSCLWELIRQGFRNSDPDPFDIVGGLLVMISFLFAFGFQAWDRSHTQIQVNHQRTETSKCSSPTQAKFCAFIPWLFYGQKIN